MALNLYDADLHVQRYKDVARAAAEAYVPTRRARRDLRRVYRTALMSAGGTLIRLGERLQGQIDELAAPELCEPLAMRANGAQPG